LGPITVCSGQADAGNEPENRAGAAFWLLWFAMLSTTTGSMLLLLGLASILYVERGSSLAAGAVFISQWLLPVFMIGWLGRLGRFQQPVRVLACLEFFQLSSYCRLRATSSPSLSPGWWRAAYWKQWPAR
jgi:hypothetical protein